MATTHHFNMHTLSSSSHYHRHINTYLAAGVSEDDRLRNSKRLVQIAQRVQFPIFLVHVYIELLDTLKCQLIALDQNSHLRMEAR